MLLRAWRPFPGEEQAAARFIEVLETISMAIDMGAGPSMIYAAEALRAFDELSTPATGA